MPDSPGVSGSDAATPVRAGARGFRWCVVLGLVLVFSLTSAGGVRRSDASFVAILAQTKTYLNILIDEWEKYSRILEDHLDKVTGIMQPFTEIHAGVRELMDDRGIRGVFRFGEAYRASLSDPRCWMSSSSSACAFQRDFSPPELQRFEMEARWGIADGGYYASDLERVAFSGTDWLDTGARIVGMVDPDAARELAEIAVLGRRIEANVHWNRWQVRRMRGMAHAGRYASRHFLRWGGPGRPGPFPPAASPCGSVDLEARRRVPADRVAHEDPTILDQALQADCLDSRDHADNPLEPRAHLSEIESATLDVAGLSGLVDMFVLEADRAAMEEEQRLELEDQVEAVRRMRYQRAVEGLDCMAAGRTAACVSGAPSRAQSRAAYRDEVVRMDVF